MGGPPGAAGMESESKRISSVVIDVIDETLAPKIQPPKDSDIVVQWSCHACTFLNHPDVPSCEMCSAMRVAAPMPVTERQSLLSENKRNSSSSSALGCTRGKARKGGQKTQGIAKFFMKNGQSGKKG